MNLKIVYGGLSKEYVELIEELISKSPKNLESVNLGSKVTRVSLKRTLRDSTVSVAFLSETDYKVQSSLSDDRLVCIFNSDSIENVFESKFGVDLGRNRSVTDFTEQDSFNEQFEEITGGSDEDSVEDLSWDDILKNYERLGNDEVYSDEDSEDESEHNTGVIEEEIEEEPITEVEEVPTKVDDHFNIQTETAVQTNREKALERTIENLKLQLEEQKQFLADSVSKSDYLVLKKEYNDLSEDLDLKVSELETTSKLNNELKEELEDIKLKFKDMFMKFEKQTNLLNQYKNSKTTEVEPIQRRYPNVEFIVPLSSNMVFKGYEYISKITDKFLFIDLTNNSYLDNFIKVKSLIKPTKWLVEGWDYRKVLVESINHENMRVISHVVHPLDPDILFKVDWDKVLGELAFENRVIINLGSIYDNGVINVLKAVQHGVVIKTLIGESKREQRIGKLALDNLEKYRVLATENTEDGFGIITERY